MGLTASFLPKPVVSTSTAACARQRLHQRKQQNLFWDPKGEEKLSKTGWSFIDRILTHGNDICLLLNASVSAYRRLDPHEPLTRSRRPRR
jgi:glutamine synthetase